MSRDMIKPTNLPWAHSHIVGFVVSWLISKLKNEIEKMINDIVEIYSASVQVS